MKKITVILLFATLLFPLVGTYFILQYQKDALKSEIKWKIANGLDRAELTFFKFHKDEVDSLVDWKHSKEFEFKGQMYDIVERELQNDSLHFWCWWDYEETQLNQMLDELVTAATQSEHKTKDKSKKVLQFLKTFYLQSKDEFLIVKTETRMKWQVTNEACNSLYSSPPSPPPRC